MSCSEDVGYEPPPVAKCPCKDCKGELFLDGFNGQKDKAFLTCKECGHCCHVEIVS